VGCLREGEGGFEVVMVEEERRRRRKAEGPVWPMRQSFYPLFVKSASEYHDFRKSTSKTEIRDKKLFVRSEKVFSPSKGARKERGRFAKWNAPFQRWIWKLEMSEDDQRQREDR